MVARRLVVSRGWPSRPAANPVQGHTRRQRFSSSNNTAQSKAQPQGCRRGPQREATLGVVSRTSDTSVGHEVDAVSFTAAHSWPPLPPLSTAKHSNALYRTHPSSTLCLPSHYYRLYTNSRHRLFLSLSTALSHSLLSPTRAHYSNSETSPTAPATNPTPPHNHTRTKPPIAPLKPRAAPRHCHTVHGARAGGATREKDFFQAGLAAPFSTQSPPL